MGATLLGGKGPGTMAAERGDLPLLRFLSEAQPLKEEENWWDQLRQIVAGHSLLKCSSAAQGTVAF